MHSPPQLADSSPLLSTSGEIERPALKRTTGRTLEERRRELLALCERQRARFGTEAQQVRAKTRWVDTGFQWLRLVKPYWWLALWGGGYWLARRYPAWRRVWRVAEAGFRVARRLTR